MIVTWLSSVEGRRFVIQHYLVVRSSETSREEERGTDDK